MSEEEIQREQDNSSTESTPTVESRRREVLRTAAGTGGLGLSGLVVPGLAAGSTEKAADSDGPVAIRGSTPEGSLDWVDVDKLVHRARHETRTDGPTFNSNLEEPQWVSTNDETPWWTGIESDSDARLLVEPKTTHQSDVGAEWSQICLDLSIELGKKTVGLEFCVGPNCDDIEGTVGVGVWETSFYWDSNCEGWIGGCFSPLVGSLCVNLNPQLIQWPSTAMFIAEGEVELCIGAGPFKNCWDATFYEVDLKNT